MKTTRKILLALLFLLAVAPLAASAQISVSAGINVGPSGRASVDLGFFYDNLAPYGHWIQRPQYGWVWTPRAVDTGWRPYQDGRWVWTDQGWTWISDEPYGWATYHYGRWYFDPELGWSWVPGDQWAPAWVSWQEGSDYVGWAPLPPGYEIGGSGYGEGYGLGPEDYVFVPERYFLAPRISVYAVPRQQVTIFFGNTRNYTNYRVNNNLIFNQGIPIDRIQRRVGHAVPHYRMTDLNASQARQRAARIAGDRVEIFRPQVQRNPQVAPPSSRPEARRSVVSATDFQRQNPNRANRAERNRQAQEAKPPTAKPPGRQPAVQGQPGQGNRPPKDDAKKPRERAQQPPQQQQPPPQAKPRKQPQQKPPQAETQQQRQQPPPQAKPQRQQQQPPQAKPRKQDQGKPPNVQAPGRQDDNQRAKAARQQQKDKKKDKDKNKEQNPPPPPPVRR